MARGKYAAKAAGQRAAAAAETVETLTARLAEERTAAAREVADLKTENQRLAGRLTSAVRSMAAAEVERVRLEAAGQVEALRESHRTAALSVAVLLGASKPEPEAETLRAIADILGVPLGEFLAATGEPTLGGRATRRFSSAKYAQGQALLESGYGPGGSRSGAMARPERAR
jgi:hypothetical protein